MKLRNSTNWTDSFLRRMLAWCAKQTGYPVRKLNEAQFRNRRERAYSGHAYWSRHIVVSIGPDSRFPTKPDGRPGMANEIMQDRLEALISVTAHELGHLVQHAEGRLRKLRQTRQTESSARFFEVQALRAFRADREVLLAAWSIEPVKESKPKPSIQEQRFAKVATALERWQRKAKLAATKVRMYKQKVRYYEHAIAAKRSPNA